MNNGSTTVSDSIISTWAEFFSVNPFSKSTGEETESINMFLPCKYILCHFVAE
jgi:hypothetical protein